MMDYDIGNNIAVAPNVICHSIFFVTLGLTTDAASESRVKFT